MNKISLPLSVQHAYATWLWIGTDLGHCGVVAGNNALAGFMRWLLWGARPRLHACFLGGSSILDKAVSCLRPWREVITGPTSVGLTRSWEATFRSMVPWLHHACLAPCQHILPTCLPTSCSFLSALLHTTLLNGPFLYIIISPTCLYGQLFHICEFHCWKNVIVIKNAICSVNPKFY